MVENIFKIVFLLVISNFFVVMFKIVVGIIIGFVVIFFEVIYFFLDLIVVFIVFIFVRILKKLVDIGYLYGYGKVENFFGIIEMILIFVVGIWMIYECV